MTDTTPWRTEDKLAELERELRMRRHVYERQVEKGTMTAAHAEIHIGLMEAIRDDYRAIAAKERLL